MGHPRIYPTGTTMYNADAAWSGYTIFPSAKGALLIDMRGNEVQLWAGLDGFPNKILPGGYVLGSSAARNPKYGFQDQLDLLQVDWDGNIVWEYRQNEQVKDGDAAAGFIARQHHDYQREGSSTGYYAPLQTPKTDGGNTLILTHKDVQNPAISGKTLLDDRFIEVDWNGKVVWEWLPSDHFDELGFDETAKTLLFRDPSLVPTGLGDWLHINSLSTLGPNKWFDAGDERFCPDNIVWDARNANILAITDKKTGKIVWRIGPNFAETPALRKLGWIVGQHHLHLIPRGLPGEGNMLVFDNGGWGGYGGASAVSRYGINNVHRDYSRVIEFNPVTLEIEWEYTAGQRFYSPYISSAQRLPNGNTLITEGSDGRIFETTRSGETVWEYINPYYHEALGGILNMVYRAYRVPYEWIPQLNIPIEESILPSPPLPLGNTTPHPQSGAMRLDAASGIIRSDICGSKPQSRPGEANSPPPLRVTNLSAANFDGEVLQSQVPVLVEFWSPACVHCGKINSVVDEIAADSAASGGVASNGAPSLKVCAINVLAETALVKRFAIQGTPTIMLFKGGAEQSRVIGEKTKADLLNLLGING